MLSSKVPWGIRTVFSVHVMRLLIGMALVRFLYPLLFTANAFTVEVTDRCVMVGLVWLAVHRYGITFETLGLSLHNVVRNVTMGIGAGFLLLSVSIYSERLYSTVLFLTPTQHPLVAQVENATSWYQLLVPLLLAGFMAPVAEEILYRLFTFLPMKEKWGLWLGAAASSLLFALMHFSVYWLGELVVVGMGLALLYYWSGSLLSSIIAHSIINTSKIVMIFLGIPII